MTRHIACLLCALLWGCSPTKGDSDSGSDTGGSATGDSASETGSVTDGGNALCDGEFVWSGATSYTVLAATWTGDLGSFTRKVSGPCMVAGDPLADADLQLLCEDGGGVQQDVAVQPNPHLQLVAGDSVVIDFLELEEAMAETQSWLAIRGQSGAIDLHFLALHATSLQAPVAGFFAPIVLAEADSCPQTIDAEGCYGTTPKLVDAQADGGAGATIASGMSATVAASFGSYLVKVIYALRLDDLKMCNSEDTSGDYFDLAAFFQFPPD